MASKDGDPNELDVLALLHEVHGTETGARGAAVEQALRTLEATHRRASLAMQTFERDGNPAARRVRDFAATSPQHDAPPADAQQLPNPNLAPVARRVTPRSSEDTAIWRPDDAPPGKRLDLPRPSSAEVTAVGPSPLPQAGDGAELAASGAGPKAQTSASTTPEVYAGRGADWSLRERTKTQRITRRRRRDDE